MNRIIKSGVQTVGTPCACAWQTFHLQPCDFINVTQLSGGAATSHEPSSTCTTTSLAFPHFLMQIQAHSLKRSTRTHVVNIAARKTSQRQEEAESESTRSFLRTFTYGPGLSVCLSVSECLHWRQLCPTVYTTSLPAKL